MGLGGGRVLNLLTTLTRHLELGRVEKYWWSAPPGEIAYLLTGHRGDGKPYFFLPHSPGVEHLSNLAVGWG